MRWKQEVLAEGHSSDSTLVLVVRLNWPWSVSDQDERHKIWISLNKTTKILKTWSSTSSMIEQVDLVFFLRAIRIKISLDHFTAFTTKRPKRQEGLIAPLRKQSRLYLAASLYSRVKYKRTSGPRAQHEGRLKSRERPSRSEWEKPIST